MFTQEGIGVLPGHAEFGSLCPVFEIREWRLENGRREEERQRSIEIEGDEKA